MSKFRVVVFISGRGSNLEALLQAASEPAYPAQVVSVICDQSAAQGLEIAKRYGVETVVVEKANPKDNFTERLIQATSKFNPQLIVLAGFMRVLKPEFIRHFRHKIINIHPSLLPAFRGLLPQKQALDAGVKFAGSTVHYVVEEVDAGPIIGQAVVAVDQNDTADTLSERILKTEHELLPSCVALVARGEANLITEAGKERVHLNDAASKLKSDTTLVSTR